MISGIAYLKSEAGGCIYLKCAGDSSCHGPAISILRFATESTDSRLSDRVLLRHRRWQCQSIDGWTKPAVEAELAIHMGRDLTGTTDRATTRSAMASLGPAIELADVNFPPDDVESILAGNIYNRHVILGQTDSSRAGCNLNGLIGRISYNTEELPSITDLQAFTGDMIDIVSHVAALLFTLGERLSLIPLHP